MSSIKIILELGYVHPRCKEIAIHRLLDIKNRSCSHGIKLTKEEITTLLLTFNWEKSTYKSFQTQNDLYKIKHDNI